MCSVRVPQARVYLHTESVATEKKSGRERQEGLAYHHKEEVRFSFPAGGIWTMILFLVEAPANVQWSFNCR